MSFRNRYLTEIFKYFNFLNFLECPTFQDMFAFTFRLCAFVFYTLSGYGYGIYRVTWNYGALFCILDLYNYFFFSEEIEEMERICWNVICVLLQDTIRSFCKY